MTTVAENAARLPVKPRPWHCLTDLEDFAIVTYDVDLGALRRVLPPQTKPLTFDAAGGERGLVSAVIFRDRDFHFRGMPWPRMNCGQVNYRAYVTNGPDVGVWFFGTSLDHWLTGIARRLWAMPWHREPIQVRARWHSGDLERFQFRCSGGWGEGEAELGPASQPVGLLPGLASPIQQSEILLDPFIGWYRRSRDDSIGRYEVRHVPLRPLRAEVRSARFVVFERLGIVGSEQVPLHAVVQQATTFDVLTPPHRTPSRW